MNLRINCGDSKTLTIPLYSDGQAFTPAVGDNLIFTVKADPSDADASALIQKVTGAGITFTGPVATVAIIHADTADLDAQVAWYDIQCQAALDGAVTTFGPYRLQLVRDITREVITSIPIYTTDPGVPGGGASVTVSPTPPSPATEGDLWYDSETGVTSTYDGTVWVAESNPPVSATIATFLGAADAAAARDAIANTPIDLAGGTELTVGGIYFDSFAAGRTLTFSGTPANGDAIELTFDASAEVIIAFPTSYRLGDTGTSTSITFPIGNHIMRWSRLDGRWYVADSSWDTGTADTTAPVLSAVSGTATGTTTATLTATTDEGNGTIYWYVGTDATSTPSAGSMINGAGADFWTSEVIVSTGIKTASATGLTEAATCQLWVMHQDLAGNNSTIANYQYFTTAGIDDAGPDPVSFSPLPDATNVTATSNLVVTFNETILLGTGNITIKDTANTPAGDVVIAVTDGTQVTLSGATLTINPTAPLLADKAYAIQMDAGIVEDAIGNTFLGIADNDTWFFATAAADATAPTLSSAAIAANGTTLTITFSEAVTRGAGYSDADWTLAAATTTPLAVAYVSGDGTATWTMAITGGPVLVAATDDPVTLDWAGTATGIQDLAPSPNDLAAIDPVVAVTNSSTQAAISYLINEDFEGTPTGWTESEAGGTVNLEYATSPLNGSKSAYLTRASGAVLAYKSLGTTYALLSLKAKAEIRVFPASNLSSRKFIGITNGSGTYLGSLTITTVDGGSTFAITALAVSTAGTPSSAKFAKGDLVYLWMDFDASTETLTVFWNSTDSKPTGDSTKQSAISGTAFADGARIEMTCDVAAAEYLFDDVQVWETV